MLEHTIQEDLLVNLRKTLSKVLETSIEGRNLLLKLDEDTSRKS